LETSDNVQKSFAMMSMASMRCIVYAEIAEKEGLHQISKFFRAFADAYKICATNALKVLRQTGVTEDNIANIVDANSYDLTQLYPRFLERAEKEGDSLSALFFKGVLASSKSHTGLLNEALENYNRFRETEYWVCQNCGHIESGDMPLICRICGGSREKFNIIR